MSSSLAGTVRIRLTGRGGQGIMLAGAILAEAAMLDGRHVTETQEYGPEARLGATKAEVIIADAPIAFPEVGRADILVCLSRDGYLKYGTRVEPSALRLVDETAVTEGAGEGLRCFPWRDRARELGLEITMNLMALGTLQAVSGIVTADSLAMAVRERVKPAFLDMNLSAVAEGARLADASGLGDEARSPAPGRARHG
ncbi:MAG: 2-oxoacid:acceptor oxidoreductase family protein [Clostridia bacterium]